MPITDAQKAALTKQASGMIGASRTNFRAGRTPTAIPSAFSLMRRLLANNSRMSGLSSQAALAAANRALAADRYARALNRSPGRVPVSVPLPSDPSLQYSSARYRYRVRVDAATSRGAESITLEIDSNTPLSRDQIEAQVPQQVNLSTYAHPAKGRRVWNAANAAGPLTVTVISAGRK